MIEYHGQVTIEAVFLDVGGTLVFPSPESMLAPLLDRGLVPSADQLNSAECRAKYVLDEFYRCPSPVSTDGNYWGGYYSRLLGLLNVQDPDLLSALVARARTSANWNRVVPGTKDILRQLRERYRLAVISNSDGHVAELLNKLGLGNLFESITDSGLVGHEKPDVRIFRAALATAGVQPGRAVYVGDIYSVDYSGSKAAGMNPILFDPVGAYTNMEFKRISSLAELPDFLSSM